MKALARNGEITHSARFSGRVSVYAGKMAAIQLVYEYVRQLTSYIGELTRFVIFSNSLSTIRTAKAERCLSRPNQFNEQLDAMARTVAEVAILWVPSHIGIEGNMIEECLGVIMDFHTFHYIKHQLLNRVA
jgi:hypothetical protein